VVKRITRDLNERLQSWGEQTVWFCRSKLKNCHSQLEYLLPISRWPAKEAIHAFVLANVHGSRISIMHLYAGDIGLLCIVEGQATGLFAKLQIIGHRNTTKRFSSTTKRSAN
jgi:hypothetical protein